MPEEKPKAQPCYNNTSRRRSTSSPWRFLSVPLMILWVSHFRLGSGLGSSAGLVWGHSCLHWFGGSSGLNGPRQPHTMSGRWCWSSAEPLSLGSVALTSLQGGTALQEDAGGSSKGFWELHNITPFTYWPKVGLRVSPDSKGGETDFTSLWEEQHRHTARGQSKGC